MRIAVSSAMGTLLCLTVTMILLAVVSVPTITDRLVELIHRTSTVRLQAARRLSGVPSLSWGGEAIQPS